MSRVVDDDESTRAETAETKARLAGVNRSLFTHMPDKTPCSRCLKVGFVRFENVIRGGLAQRHYYCGACNHSWTISAEGDPKPRALASDRQQKAATKAKRGHRRRT